MTTRALLVPALLAVAAVPPAASAAAVPDRVIDEVSAPMDVGIDGDVVAYTRRVGTRGVEVVVRDGDRPVVRLAAGRGSSPVGVGRDRAGKRVVAYLRCGTQCDLLAYSPSAGRSRVVDRGVAKATDLAVGKGRVFWADGKRVRSRALDGGGVRIEAVVPKLKPTGLDSDGTTLAVTGDMSDDLDGSATGISITRPGSGRAHLRAKRGYGEEYAGFRVPVLTAKGVTTLVDRFTSGTSTAYADLAAGERRWDKRTTGGMRILTWDASGSRAVFVEAPTNVGCGIGELFDDKLVRRAPCRIVLADLSQERVLPPRISIERRVATVTRTTMRGGRIAGRLAQAGVAVEVREGAKVVATLTTDALGRVALPEGESEDGLAITAATTPVSYAFASGY